jgi:hypothetical protein
VITDRKEIEGTGRHATIGSNGLLDDGIFG